LAEKKIGRKKNWPKYWPAAITSLRCMQKNKNIGKNIFLVLYTMFKAPISTIPQ
jgi:ribosomal protein L19E